MKSHRYAVSFHKMFVLNLLFQSILDDVEGIGPKRKKELIKTFLVLLKIKRNDSRQLEEVLPKSGKNLFTVLQKHQIII